MIDSRRILVIDDEPDIVELILYNLSNEGFAVSTAPDGEEALRSIKKDDFCADHSRSNAAGDPGHGTLPHPEERS